MSRSLDPPDTRAQHVLRQPALREVIPSDPGVSFRFYLHDEPHPFAGWNYHPEYEVHLILKSSGRYVVGDKVGSYAPGQLTMIGPNLPHTWVADRGGDVLHDAHAVLHFRDEWIRACQTTMPELAALDPLLTRAAHGIEFAGAVLESAAQAMLAVSIAVDAAARLIKVLDLLRILAAAPSEDSRLIVRAWEPQAKHGSPDLIGPAIDYVLANLGGEVRLRDAARLAALSDSAFSRYFRAASGQTFTDMVRQLRLTQACRLLENTSMPIAGIAAEVGYANLSNFNRQFRAAYGLTPRDYRATRR